MSTSFGTSKGRGGGVPYLSPKQVGPNQDFIRNPMIGKKQ